MPETFPHGPIVKRDNNGRPSQIFLSAQAGLGLDLLRSALGEHAQLTDRIRAQDDRAKNHTNATDLVAPLTDRPDSAEFIPIPSRSYSPHNA